MATPQEMVNEMVNKDQICYPNLADRHSTNCVIPWGGWPFSSVSQLRSNKIFKRKSKYEKVIDDDPEEKCDFIDTFENEELDLSIAKKNDDILDEYQYVPDEYQYVPDAWISDVVVADENNADDFADFDRDVAPWEDSVTPDCAVDSVSKLIFKSFEHPTLGYVSLEINNVGLEIYTDVGSYNAWEETMIMDTEHHMIRGWSIEFPITRMDKVNGTGMKMDNLRFSTTSL